MEALEVNLTELLFGKFEPPVSHLSVRHRIGFSECARYVPTLPQGRPSKKDLPIESRLPPSAKRIMEIMKQQVKPISAIGMEKKTPWTRNHCNMIMGTLFKEGLLTRFKVKGNGTSHFMYSVKK